MQGKAFYNNYCVDECPQHYEANEEQRVCVRCKFECSSEDCTVGYRKQCLIQCPAGTFADFFTQENAYCKNCSEKCSNCVSTSECTECSAGLILVDGQCLEECLYGSWNTVEEMCQIEVNPEIEEIIGGILYVLVFDNPFELNDFLQ